MVDGSSTMLSARNFAMNNNCSFFVRHERIPEMHSDITAKIAFSGSGLLFVCVPVAVDGLPPAAAAGGLRSSWGKGPAGAKVCPAELLGIGCC